MACPAWRMNIGLLQVLWPCHRGGCGWHLDDLRPLVAHVIERIYISRRFRNDTERLAKLSELYTMMTKTVGGRSSDYP